MDSLEYGRAYRAANKERIQAYMRDYYLRHGGANRYRIIAGASRQSKVCPRCGMEKSREDFTVRKTGARIGHLSGRCKACNVQLQKDRKQRDPTIYRRCEWPSKLKRLYGITVEQYHKMLYDQGGGCAICGSKEPGGRKYVREGKPKFHIDHCHATGVVRGVLCDRCNRALGMIRDDPKTALRMADYLEKRRVPRQIPKP